jgi:hypothetical protein
MPKLKSTVILVMGLSLLVSVGSVLAGPRGERTPARFAPRSLDRQPATAINPLDGSIWAAWAWRDGAEYSIAISIQTDGVWSEPFFIGRDDSLNQMSPALVFDDHGVAYLAWTVLPVKRILIATFPEGLQSGFEVHTASHEGVPSGMPALTVVSNRLVLAFRTPQKTVLRTLPLYPSGAAGMRGVQEGPDAVDPLGWTWGDVGGERDEDHSGETWNEDPDDQNTSSTVRPLSKN